MQLQTTSTETSGKISERGGRRVRVLLAEDDDDVRTALQHFLESEGFDVQAVSNGADMLEILAASVLLENTRPEPDIIVTDVRMPCFNGLHIMESLRADGWRNPAIVMSAYGDDAMVERIGRLEKVTFFTKPFDLDQFEAALHRLIPAT